MSGFLFSSHDGFGLGHVRRNAKIASALRSIDRRTPITLVTGVATRFAWLDQSGVNVVRVPPILKDTGGDYAAAGMSLHEAVAQRARSFAEAVERLDPDVLIVDRHPFGLFGELREGLEHAHRRGARIVLGLRDVLDEPATVAHELASERWVGASDVYDEAMVYGEALLCDHEEEYGLPLRPVYCGWVADAVRPLRRQPHLLAVTAGGGGDGEEICRLGVEVLRLKPRWRAIVVVGPYAGAHVLKTQSARQVRRRLEIAPNVNGCSRMFGRAGGVLAMAGYNSAYEALAAGLRPIFRPRIAPRREQVIRATRLADLGFADVVPENADPIDVAGLLDRPRMLHPNALARAGIALDGAQRAAGHLVQLAGRRRAARVA